MPTGRTPPKMIGATPAAAFSSNVYNVDTVVRSSLSSTPTTSGTRKRVRRDFPTDLNKEESLVSLDSLDVLSSKIETLVASITKSDDKISKLLKDNTLMRQELKTIHDLLRCLISEKKTPSFSTNQKSYASVVLSKDIVVIEPKDSSQSSDATREAVLKSVDPVEFGVRGVKNGKNGKIVIECRSSNDSNNIKIAAGNTLGNNYIVKAPIKRNPKVRVFGLSTDLSETTLQETIISQNNTIFTSDSKVKIFRKFASKKLPIRYGFKMECDPETFARLMEAQKVCIGWDSCWVNEDFNLLRCYNCWNFHHTNASCVIPIRCSQCGGTHDYKDCTSEIVKCCVCEDISSTTRLDLDIAHAANSLLCPTYIHKIELEKRNIRYE